MIPFAKPMIDAMDIAAVVAALHNSRLTEGPIVEEFEKAFGEMHDGHAVAVSNCTAALFLAFTHYRRQIDVNPVTMTAMTHVATAHAAEMAGITVQFTDCGENGRTGFLPVGVSYLGAPAQGKVLDYATAVGLPCGDSIACYSFYPAKHITTGEGGMIVCKSAKVATWFRRVRAFGKVTKDGKFDVIDSGLNFRMSEINGALGLAQLRHLPRWLATRKRNYETLAEELPLRVLDTSGGSYYALAAYVPDGVDRDAFRGRLLRRGVETSVYYPVPIPRLTYYQSRHKDWRFPNAERIAAHSIAFPIGPHIGENELEQIIGAVRKTL